MELKSANGILYKINKYNKSKFLEECTVGSTVDISEKFEDVTIQRVVDLLDQTDKIVNSYNIDDSMKILEFSVFLLATELMKIYSEFVYDFISPPNNCYTTESLNRYDATITPKQEHVFVKACREGNETVVKDFLMYPLKYVSKEQRDYIEYAYEDGVYIACENNFLNIVKIILGDCKKNYYGYSSKYLASGLRGACSGGRVIIAKLMIKYGADDKYMHSLYEACAGGHVDLINLLLDTPNIRKQYENREDTALTHNSFKTGNIKVIDTLVDAGMVSYSDKMALSGACSNGNKEFVDFVINKGNHNSINSWNSGFRGACIGGHIDIAKMMISKGMDKGRNSSYLIDDMYIAAKKGGNMELVMYIDRYSDKYREWDEGDPQPGLAYDAFNVIYKNYCNFKHKEFDRKWPNIGNDIRFLVLKEAHDSKLLMWKNFGRGTDGDDYCDCSYGCGSRNGGSGCICDWVCPYHRLYDEDYDDIVDNTNGHGECDIDNYDYYEYKKKILSLSG